jgi:hypothetical protein
MDAAEMITPSGQLTTPSARTSAETGSPTALPFGPYAGEAVDAVAVMDPGYLADLVREGVGPAVLRAEAARALANRGRLVTIAPRGGPRSWIFAPHVLSGPGGTRWVLTRRLRTLAVVAVLGALAVAAWSERVPGGRPPGTLADPARPAVSDGAAVAGDAFGPSAGSQGADRVIAARTMPTTTGGVDRTTAGGDRVAGPSSPPGTGQPGASGDGAAGGAGSVSPGAPCGGRVAGAIPAESAADFVGSFQTVELPVVKATDTGRVTFLNSHDPYQGHFYVAIFPSEYERFPAPPAEYFAGRCVVVQGAIETYRGAPQIVVRDPADIRIVGE